MKAKGQRRYMKIDDTVYQSLAFRTLPTAAAKLWLDLRTQFNGANNGNISAVMSVLVHRGWVSTSTLQNALRELLARGLIAHTRRGRPGPFRVCSLYRFCDLPCAKNEARFIEGRIATCEFAEWKPNGAAEKIRASEIEATLLRKSKCYRFENRSVEALTASEIEAQKNGEIGAKPAPTLAFCGIGARDRQHFENRSALYIPGGRGKNGGAAGVVDLESDPVLPERPEPKPLANEFDRAHQRWERKARAAATPRGRDSLQKRKKV